MSKNIDETGERHLQDRLQELGLSPKEAAVYLALLPRQDTGTSVLIKATGLHGQFVYSALDKLEEMGLAKHVIQNGRKKFSANPPQRLLSLIEEKRLSAQSVAKELQARFAGRHEQSFEVYQGDSAFIAHQMDLLRRAPEEAEWDVIATETERYMATFETYGMAEEFDKLRKSKNIRIRYIGAPAQRTQLAMWEKNWFDWTYKIFPGLGVGLISIEILPETVSFVVYGEQILNFTLASKEVADGYREFFNAVWALAQK